MKRIYNEILKNTIDGNITKEVATKLIKTIEEDESSDIAIIGMSASYPKADNLDKFWNMLLGGMDCFDELPEKRKKELLAYNELKGIRPENEKYIVGAYLNEIDNFDCHFFNVAPNDADLMDPCQRMFLENVYHTIEDAGYVKKIKGSNTGVFIGYANDLRVGYSDFIETMDPSSSKYAITGNLHSIISSRFSFFKDLKGPAVLIDTACSSSLVALHYACNSILNGDCDKAIIGGVKINLYPMDNDHKIGIESSDGKTRSFDNASDGTGCGEGVASIMIKPLRAAIKDMDHIYAVIKGSAVNQDGETSGITAPNVNSQINVLRSAWNKAQIDPSDLDFIEAHGTATQLGDTIEIEALTEAFSKYSCKKQYCGLTAVKSNIGHLYEASGITGIIKSALCLKNKMVPGISNFYVPNRNINFEDSPLYIIDRTINLETKEKKYLCGVSSFGFSGTNCHVVLEEAPEIMMPIGSQEEKEEIFTLSAHTKSSLLDYIKIYADFVLKNETNSLRNICYNTNCLKEQFACRIAFIVNSKEDLYNKLVHITKDNLTNGSVNYSEHKIIYSTKKEYMDNELSICSYNKLCEQTKIILCENDEDRNQKLVRNYLSGAEVDWLQYYQENRHKIFIPLYPFARDEHWVKVNKIDLDKRTDLKQEGKTLHPLVERLVMETPDTDIYITNFTAEKHFVLSDHVIMGLHVIPGTTYLEVAEFLGERYFGTRNICIKGIYFMVPIALQYGEHRFAKIIVNQEGDTVHFTICSKNEDDEWVMHVSGDLEAVSGGTASKVDLYSIMKSFDTEPRDINQNELTKGFIEFKTRWLNYKKLYYKKNFALGVLELKDECKEDLEKYYLHPSLMDMAVNVVSLTLGKRYLPLSYEKVTIYGPTPQKFYSIVHFDEDDFNGETISFNAELIDEHGNVFAEIVNYYIKKVHEFKHLLRRDNNYAEIIWEEKNISKEVSLTGKKVAVLSFDKSEMYGKLVEILQQQNNVVVSSLVNDSILQTEEFESIYSFTQDGFYSIADMIQQKHIERIIFVFSHNDEYAVECIEKDKDVLKVLFYLTKALAKNSDGNLSVLMLGNSVRSGKNEELILNAYNQSVYTMCKAINKERYQFKVKSVDISSIDELQFAVNEFENMATDCTVFWMGKAYIEIVVKKNIEEIPFRDGRVQDGGTYVITGGTGGIGLEIAKELAGENRINLVLIARSEMGNSNWAELLQGELNEKKRNFYKTLKEIEESGSNITYYSCDVSIYNDLQNVFADIISKFGKVNGIFHCAGLPGNGFVLTKKESEFDGVIMPKINATVNLYNVSKNMKLDFCVLFSSVASVMALPGQSDYSAANAFMDAFAKLHANENFVAINWPTVEDVGMAYDNNVDIDTLFKTIKVKNAMYILQQVMSRQISYIVVGEWNYNQEIFEIVNLNYSKEIFNNLMKQKNKLKNDNDTEKVNITLSGRNDGAYTEYEKEIGSIWGRVLGYSEINIYDSFYELGGDSILAVKLNNEVNKIYNTNISITELFNYLTIYDFANYLDSKLHSTQEIKIQIMRAEEKEYYSASAGQTRMFFADQSMDNDTLYNIPLIFELKGNVVKNKIGEVLQKLVNRQGALRTSFDTVNGELVQRVEKHIDFNFETNECNEDCLDEFIQNYLIRKFDMTEAPLFRANFISCTNGNKYLFMDIHHVIVDGYSLVVLLNDFMCLYDNKDIKELQIQYTDYSQWEKEAIEKDMFQEQDNYWIRQLASFPEPLNLNTDFPRPKIQSAEGDFVQFNIKEELYKRLKDVARKNNVTMFTILLSGFYIFLYKQTNQEDFIVGTPTAGRFDATLEDMLGMFFNILPMRKQVDGNMTIKQLLTEVSELVARGMENQQYVYDNLLSKLNLKHSMDRSILFDVLFKLQNITKEVVVSDVGTPEMKFTLSDMTLKSYPFKKNRAKHDLTLEILVRDNYLECYFEYCTKLFTKDTVERFAEHLINIYKYMEKTEEGFLKDVEPLAFDEKNIIINQFNDTDAPYPEGKTLQLLFEEQVERTPNGKAVYFNGYSITYRELNNRANRFAWTLRKKGVGSDDIVGIMTDRSIDMIVGIYGILKAGAAYMPVDRRYPQERIKYMLENSGAKVLVVEYEEEAKPYDVEAIVLMDLSLWEDNSENPESICSDQNLAYIIYTSGTTGRPKGVMIEHRAIVNRLNWMQKEYPIGEEDVILQKTTYTFDVSVWEIIWWSLTGASVMMLPQGEEKDPEAIVKHIQEGHVTTMHFVPSMLSVFLKYVTTQETYSEIASLKTVFASGEALKKYQSDVFYEEITLRNGTSLVNLYGPTEAAVDVTVYDCKVNHASEVIYIGKPIDNIRLYILDKEGNLVPMGVAGELCISGVGVARGYINNEILTNEKFVKNPYDEAGRMYRTGDLARWRTDGNIEYLGRIDNQVKIRGFRIELEEIEKVIMKVDEILDSAVIAKDGEDGKYLCAYYVESKPVRLRKIRQAISNNLPDYMMPSYFVKIDSIPVTENGKLDRKALPEPEINSLRENKYRKPETDMQVKLAKVWEEVLKVEKIGIDDNFFQLGGHSLNGVLVTSRIRNEIGINVPLKEIFRFKTLGELASFMDSLQQNDIYDIIPSEEMREVYPVTFEQMGIYVANTKNTNYNISFVAIVNGNIDIMKLKEVAEKIYTRHDILKTAFQYVEGNLIQQVYRDLDVSVNVIRLDTEGEIQAAIDEFNTSFSLDQAPLFKVMIIMNGRNKAYLVFNIHHIIFDGFSIGNLMKEFFDLYKEVDVPRPKLQYGDYALWQEAFKMTDEYKIQEQYWANLFAQPLDELMLPYDFYNMALSEGDVVSCDLPQEGIRKLSQDTEATPFMVCLLAYAVLLQKYTQQKDIVIGVPVMGRKNADIEELLGMFVKSVPIRFTINPNESFTQLLKNVKKNVLQAFEYQDYSFGELQGKLGVDKKEQRGLFNTMLSMQNISYPNIKSDEFEMNSYAVYNHRAKYPLELFVYDIDDAIKLELNYATNMFMKSTVEILLNDYVAIIEAVTRNSSIRIFDIKIVDKESTVALNKEIQDLQKEMDIDFDF